MGQTDSYPDAAPPRAIAGLLRPPSLSRVRERVAAQRPGEGATDRSRKRG